MSSPRHLDSATPAALREASAVVLLCLGLLTLLSLGSSHPADLSLNVSGTGVIRNWIGPAGAYWADLLLQSIGLGAYALGAGLLLAGGRALAGRRILPGLREAVGILLLMVAVGLLAQLLLRGPARPYPPGGVLGAIFGRALRARFAPLGAVILAGSLLLVALTLTAEGILVGLGGRGWHVLRRAGCGLLAAARRLRGLSERFSPAQEPPPPRLRVVADGGPRSKRRDGRVARPTPPELALVSGLAGDEGEEDAGEASPSPSAARARLRKPTLAKVTPPRPSVALRAPDDVDLSEREATKKRGLATQGDKKRGSTSQGHAGEPAQGGYNDDDVVGVGEHGAGGVAAGEGRFDAGAEGRGRGVAADLAGAGLVGSGTGSPGSATQSPPARGAVGELTAADFGSEGGAGGIQEASPVGVSGARSPGKKVAEPQIVDARPEVDVEALDRVLAIPAEARQFELPPASLLDFHAAVREPVDPEKLRDNAQRLTKTLMDYGIDGHVREIRPGPVVTMYEYVPGPGIKLSKIASLADDLAMSMEALRVRIVAPIPGKGAVGIEIPNETRETVYLKEIVAHETFRKAKSHLTIALGKDIEGAAYVADLARMPHLLVAGATGAGKSVSINAMIMSVLFKATPAEVRMIMVDPKMLELSVYEGIPHLLLPVVTDPKKAALALRWAVEEMERRYELLSAVGVRSIDGYNTKVRAAAEAGESVTVPDPDDADAPQKVCEPLPYLLVIVDELADLMMVASREVETSIMRLAQMARAAGIHLILATQRPSVDVLTGVIKANFPTRIAFQVASRHDSRTIIDANGAEHLLGSGDMLYLSPGAGGMMRVHGAYVSDQEIERAVNFLREQGRPQYDESILAPRGDDQEEGEQEEIFQDEMYDQAVAIVAETRQASISMIQRRLRIGYNRAARMVERMETEGIVGPADGAKPRDVLVSSLSA